MIIDDFKHQFRELDKSMSDEDIAIDIIILGRNFYSVEEDRRKSVANFLGQSSQGFNIIPKNYLSKEILKSEIDRKIKEYGISTKLSALSYEEFAQHLVSNQGYIGDIHHEYINKSLLISAIKNRPDEMAIKEKYLIKHKNLIDADLANEMVSLTLKYIYLIPDSSLITDQSLLSGLRSEPNGAFILNEMGKKNLINQAVSEGVWCSLISKPESLEQAIKSRMKMQKTKINEILYLNAFISSFSIKDVAPLMKTEGRRRILVELFSNHDLLSVFSNNNFIKGILLEGSLGI